MRSAKTIPVILAASALGVLAACSARPPEAAPVGTAPRSASEQDLVTLDAAAQKAGGVASEAVQLGRLPDVLHVNGRIGVNENRTARVGAIVEGRVINVYANVGDRVTRGQRLAEYHSHEVHDARSEYAKARAEMDRRRASLQFARHARDRAQKLYELKAGPLEQVQRTEADLREAETAITSAQAELGRIEEHLSHLGLTAEGAVEEYGRPRRPIPGEFEKDELVPAVAPLDGTILERLVSPGAVVNTATDLFRITDLSSLWVHAAVPERHLAAVRLGRQVEILVQAYGDQPFRGRISQIGDLLDPSTRTVQVRCEVSNPERKLKPEMYATVSFDLGETREALLLPLAALQDVAGESTVFVRESETQFRARRVEPGRQSGPSVEILSGLRAGDQVVTSGAFVLKSELLKSLMVQE